MGRDNYTYDALYEAYEPQLNELKSIYDMSDHAGSECDVVVEQMCQNLIGEKVIVLNYPPEGEKIFVAKEVVITRVEEQYVYVLDELAEIKIYIPYNYIYHPAILAALKCI